MNEYLNSGEKAASAPSPEPKVTRRNKPDQAPQAGNRGSPASDAVKARSGAMQGAGNRQLNQLLAQGASAGASGLQSPGQARGSEQQLEQIRATAREGLSGSGTQLPFADQIQASFGEHEVSSVQAHVGDGAKAAASSMGAAAYAAGGQVAFGEAPSLRTAAHEAAHVVQQRQGVALPGGVGQAGDRHEQQADQVADRVVAGQPATDLLGPAGEQRQGGMVPQQVQMSPIDDLVKGVRNIGRRIRNWIDLLGPKRDLLNRMRDAAWVREAAKDVDMNAHPEHKTMLDLQFGLRVLGVQAEVLGMALRIAGCDTLKAVKGLSREFDRWKKQRGKSFKKEVKELVKGFRDTEKEWLKSYTGWGTKEKKGVVVNKAGNPADLKLEPGMSSKVTLITGVQFSYTFSDRANKVEGKEKKSYAASHPWTAKQKTTFESKVQKQLDKVWGDGAKKKQFKVDRPEDFLLAKEARKWSAITGAFRGTIKNGAAGPAIEVVRGRPGEYIRAFSTRLVEADISNAGGGQSVMAHEFGHFGLNLPDEYSETGASGTTDFGGQAMIDRMNKALAWYGPQIAAADKTIADNAGPEKEKKQARDEATDRKSKLIADRDAVNSYMATFNQRHLYRLAPQNRTGANWPPVPPELFSTWGSDFYAPGQHTRRGGAEHAYQQSDEDRVMVGGDRVEPYYYEGVLEVLNELVATHPRQVHFEHNVKPGSKDKAKVDAIRKFNIEVDAGKVKAPADIVP